MSCEYDYFRLTNCLLEVDLMDHFCHLTTKLIFSVQFNVNLTMYFTIQNIKKEIFRFLKSIRTTNCKPSTVQRSLEMFNQIVITI